ncbi:YlxQ family RNA-binding protein [Streptohalobacillus salinus]|uniref:YlxQ family RNA-binding protein n=1 Tax=Streptohalobacillus salinus TaxID=621096 RepID=UPI000D762DDF|nr:YlxQ family RNA-binding protein [Streptohalobacillus salinus]
MSNQQKYLSMLGLAMRARRLSLGEDQIIKDIKRNEAKLVLIAEDTGYQTHKKLTDKCKFYEVDYKIICDRDSLSIAIGKSGRVAVAVLDEGFAKKIASLIDQK